MAVGDFINCKAFGDYLITQEPVYDKAVVEDVRPVQAGLMGFYETAPFDAYSGVQHTFDRVNAVFPDLRAEWFDVTTGSCVGNPCDPVQNAIGMGNQRFTYHLEGQSWTSQLFCFDEIMTRTKAKESLAYYISDVLKPATNWITNFYLMRKAMELAGKKVVVRTPVNGQLPEFNFTWDAGGFEFLNITDSNTGLPTDPTGLLTPNILQWYTFEQFANGSMNAKKDGFEALQLHTDIDTLHYLQKEDPVLLNAWRFGNFDPANKEFYAYGFMGFVGNYYVKCLLFPMRFNRISTGRYQLLMPYKNIPATNGIRDIPNPDYIKAWYQFSYINNPRALRFMAFNPEAVNPQMPFLVRNYGGQWRFAMNNLGADACGVAIENMRMNKGRFYADYRWSMKPEHPEWLVVFFHIRTQPCLNIIEPCGTDPGYPEQTYDSDNDPCPTDAVFTAKAAANTHFKVAANALTCSGNFVTAAAIDETTFSAFVTTLGVRWAAAGLAGTWSVYDATALQFQLIGTDCDGVTVPFTL